MSLSSRLGLIAGTRSLTKINLVVISGFGVNSIILKEYIRYLEEFFNVYFIDLPGFTKTTKILSTVSIDSYVEYIEREMEKIPWSNFWLGGMSFGFYLANRAAVDKRSLGYFAIEPYVGETGLSLGKPKELFFDALVKSLVKLGVSSEIWESSSFPKILKLFSGCSTEEAAEMLKDIDSKTFFQTAQLLLEDHEETIFRKTPYALFINENDTSVNGRYIQTLFEKNVKDLFIVPITTDHYPKEITVSYFKEHIPTQRLYEAIRWGNSLREYKEEK